MTAAEQEWEPGDPIYSRESRSFWSGYLYNFRDTGPENRREDDCVCPDRASWPEPLFKDSLDRYRDEITGERYGG